MAIGFGFSPRAIPQFDLMPPGGYQPLDLASLGQQFFQGLAQGEQRFDKNQQRQAQDETARLTLAALGQTTPTTGPQPQSLSALGQTAAAPAAPSMTGGGARTMSMPTGTAAENETQFLSTVKGAGLTNPFGLAAVGAYGKAESGFSPQNVARTWSDPSESGQAGTSGGVMSWRNERLAKMRAFAQANGDNPNAPSVVTQAKFFANEDPNLIPRLQAAKSPEEANQIMADAWRFAGYNRPGTGEHANRENLTRAYLARVNGIGGAPAAAPAQPSPGGLPPVALAALQANPDQQAVQVLAQAYKQAGEARPFDAALRAVGKFAGPQSDISAGALVNMIGGGPKAAPVQFAESEADVQRLEQPMVPQTATAAVGSPPMGDMPAPGAQNAQFFVPPGQAQQVAQPASPPATRPAPQQAPLAAPAAQGVSVPAHVQAMLQSGNRYTRQQGVALAQEYLKKASEPVNGVVVNGRLVNPRTGAQIADFSDSNKLPSSVQEYEYARKQGYQGSFQDFQVEQKRAGATNLTVDASQKAQNKFDEGMASKQAERWSGYIGAADEAQTKLADIQVLRETSRRLGSQGSSANMKAIIGPYAESLGVNVEGLSDIQLYESVTKRLAPQLRAPGSGSTSDIEYKGFVAAIGPLSNNPASREMIFDTFEAAARNDLTRGEIATRLANGEISRGQAEKELRALPNPLQAFRQFREANPDIVGEAIKQGRTAGAAKPAPSGSPAAPKAGDIQKGYRFKGGDPSSPSSWERAQ